MYFKKKRATVKSEVVHTHDVRPLEVGLHLIYASLIRS